MGLRALCGKGVEAMSGRSLAPKVRFDNYPEERVELVKRCEATVRRIRFDATALPVADLTFASGDTGICLVVELRVPDRNQPDVLEWATVYRTLVCPWAPLDANGPEYLVGWLRETIANTLAHEVDEALTYGGRRVYDPHRSLGGGDGPAA